jgi:hypothetical protein
MLSLEPSPRPAVDGVLTVGVPLAKPEITRRPPVPFPVVSANEMKALSATALADPTGQYLIDDTVSPLKLGAVREPTTWLDELKYFT